jgi:hypothetical protein
VPRPAWALRSLGVAGRVRYDVSVPAPPRSRWYPPAGSPSHFSASALPPPGAPSLRWSLPVALVFATIAACAPNYAEPRVSVRLVGSPPDALVTVDDQVVGPLARVAAKGLSVSEGKHRVTVERPGYFPWDKEVEAKSGGAVVQLDVQLEKIPE